MMMPGMEYMFPGAKYVTEYPQGMKNLKGGGEAFPQQPTAKRFFDYGWVPPGPINFYQNGGVPEAFPQQPPADIFFSGADWTPPFQQEGGCVECGDDYKKGGWIQEATKDIKKRGTEGVCSGSNFGGPGCPPGSKRYNLAKTFRAMVKKRADGGEANSDDQDDFLAQYRNNFMNHVKSNLYFNLADEAAQEVGDMEENMQYAQMGTQVLDPWEIARLQLMGNEDPRFRSAGWQMTDPMAREQQQAHPLEATAAMTNQVKQRRGFNGELAANVTMAGINSLSSLFNNQEDNIDDFMQKNSLADNQFYSMAANRIQDQGRYNWTGMSNGMIDPNSMNVIQQPGMDFVRFQEGGAYELDDNEIDQILKMGGTIQYVK
jgi:hypothetical protein